MMNRQHHQACAACRYYRRKCPPDCPLAPYFPPENQQQFLNVHKLFGLSNFLKLTQNIDDNEAKEIAIKTMIFQANIRDVDKVGGCFRIICDLQLQIHDLIAELKLVRRRLAFHRSLRHNNGNVGVDSLSTGTNPFPHFDQNHQHDLHDGLKSLLPCSSFHQTLGKQPLIVDDECKDIKPMFIPFEVGQPPPPPPISLHSSSDKVVIKQEEASIQQKQELSLKASAVIAASQFPQTDSSGLLD